MHASRTLGGDRHNDSAAAPLDCGRGQVLPKLWIPSLNRPIAFHGFHLAGAQIAIWWKHQADLRVNVNGGAISVGHPYGMTGTRVAGHTLLEGRHRNARLAVMTMCVGGGKGAASLFEID